MRPFFAFVAISLLAVTAAASEPAATDSVPPTESVELQAAEQREILRADNRSIEGLEIEVRPDGILKVDLRGRFQHALAVRIEPDGTSTIECIDDAEMMAAFLAEVVEESATRRHETAEK